LAPLRQKGCVSNTIRVHAGGGAYKREGVKGEPHNVVVRVRLLGRFDVSVGARVVIDNTWNRRKAMAVLKLLALQDDRRIHREQALDILWPDFSPEAADNNLRKSIHYVRAALGNTVGVLITSASDMLVLSPNVDIDIEAFQAAASKACASRTDTALYEEALGLYRGDLLPEDLYEDWTEPRRKDLRARCVRLLSEVSQLYLLRGEPGRAIERLGQLLVLDPHNEEAYRSLMRLDAGMGRRAQAVRTYMKCRQALEADLGLTPSEETEALYREIVEERFPATSGARGRIGAGPLGQLALAPFVGREQELARLRTALDNALSGRGALVLLAGEPGIGKTRLAEELGIYAALRGAGVFIGCCHDDEAAPAYWPWVEIIRSYVSDRDPAALMSEMGAGAGDIARLVPAICDRLPDLSAPATADPEEARFRLQDSICTLLRNASARRPLMLFLDDLQWADKSTLLLLQFLARDIRGNRILLVGASRDMDVDAAHPLSQAMATLQTSDVAQRYTLAGLSHDEVRKMIAAIGEREPRPFLVDGVFDRTEGNPFFVRELLDDLIEGQKIRREDGKLALSELSSDEWGIPESVRDVLRGRLGRLSSNCIRFLSVASAMPGSFSWKVLAPACGGDEDHLLDALDEALSAQILREKDFSDGGYVYEFTHDLIRQAIYEDLSRTRRGRIHRQIGETVEGLCGAELPTNLAAMTYHFFKALPIGDVDKAIKYTSLAADNAHALFAYEEAARLYELSLHAGAQKDDFDQMQRCELLIAIGDAHEASGETLRAKAIFVEAAEAARQARAPGLLARAALGVAGPAVVIETDEVATQLLEEALHALGDEGSALKARVLVRLAANLYRSNAIDRMETLSQEAVEIARRSNDPRTLGYVLAMRQFIIRGRASVDEQVALAREVVRLADEIDDEEMRVHGRHLLLLLKLEAGDIAGADRDIGMLSERTQRLRRPIHQWRLALVKAMRAIMDGRFDEGERLAQAALATGRRVRQSDAGTFFLSQMFMLRREQGRLQELEPTIRGYVDRQSTLDANVRCALAQLHSELGNEREARDLFEQLAASEFAEVPKNALWLGSIVLLSQTCAFLGDSRRAAILHAILKPYASVNGVLGYGATCTGSTSRYLGLLATTTRRWDDAATHFEDALRMNAEMGAEPYLAHTQHEYAGMLLARGRAVDRKRAFELLDDALATARRLGMKGLVEDATKVRADCPGVTKKTLERSRSNGSPTRFSI
jgi:predicted ATPase/DNA-binding SARP family transcriptional activator